VFDAARDMMWVRVVLLCQLNIAVLLLGERRDGCVLNGNMCTRLSLWVPCTTFRAV